MKLTPGIGLVGAALLAIVAVGAWPLACVSNVPDDVGADAGGDDGSADGSSGDDTAVDEGGSADAGDDTDADAGPTCLPDQLACDGGCVANSASSCGACDRTCTGGTPVCSPTDDAGTSFACTSGCAAGLVLCNTACVNEQTSDTSCGGCGASFTCAVGQTCSGGRCVCNVTSCPTGCCDTLGQCRQTPTCGSSGDTCAAGCPATVAESSHLILWLVGDDYDYSTGSQMWRDRSGHGANGSCASLACPGQLTVNGHRYVSFPGAGDGFALTDPSGDFQTQTFTMFLVVRPNAGAAAYDQLFAFYAGGNYVKLQRDSANPNLVFQVIPGNGTSNYVVSQAGYGWNSHWERVVATVDATGNATIYLFNNVDGIDTSTTGNVGAPANVDYSSSYLGTSPTNPGTAGFYGDIAEIIVYNSTLGSGSTTAVNDYLKTRYGF